MGTRYSPAGEQWMDCLSQPCTSMPRKVEIVYRQISNAEPIFRKKGTNQLGQCRFSSSLGSGDTNYEWAPVFSMPGSDVLNQWYKPRLCINSIGFRKDFLFNKLPNKLRIQCSMKRRLAVCFSEFTVIQPRRSIVVCSHYWSCVRMPR